ncbi:MAG: FAD-dependent oxidoreductase [Pseudomonadota bacterium]|nr:FAD-dependent oxidoreductase [Pseudomonadota bacterium]
MSVTFGIVGSGPSGMYAADALLKNFSNCKIDVFDKIPMPFGLIRYGVAPDHFKTKNTARQFHRTLELDQVRYLGNVEIGRDISVSELEENYDAVIFAIGAYNDRKLGIPGEELPGVYGACAFVGWYNAHPDFRDINPMLDGRNAAVIGIGNVALDVCRVLTKTRSEMKGSDISAPALDIIQEMPIEAVHMFGRRGPIEAGFTPKELGEVRNLEQCSAVVSADQLPEKIEGKFEGREKGIKEKNLAILRELSKQHKTEKPVTMHFQFYASPIEILGTKRVEGIRLERTEVNNGKAISTGETFDVPCCSIITAIGYQTSPPEGLPLNGVTIANTDGWIRDNLYVVGWAKRGSSGTIPTNGPDSRNVVNVITDNLNKNKSTTPKTGGEAIDKLLSTRRVRVVSINDVQRIKDAETANATTGHPWEKFTSIKEMLAVLD